ncbi:hypothetical protein EG329_005254 [Mollisiaceae sp. DMI_Dod_QoI]|nr:hypothetical protein EG329_005254 [Helotiales sp. DMI_Dod_QoI]
MFRRRNKSRAPNNATETSNHEGRLIRKADSLEALPHLFHDLGIQSNVLVSAEYTHATGILTPEKVHLALRKVIDQHPALSIIGVTRPSTKKAGHHRLWEAHLPVIHFQDCVEFHDVDFDGDGQLSQTVEDIHNTWFDTQDKTKPWWKLVILNQKTVIFVFHHAIADGLSGYAFHRSFLSALNEVEEAAVPVEESQSVMTPRIDPASLPSPLDDIKEKLSWFYVIKNFLFWVLIRFFVSDKYFLFSDAVVTHSYPTVKRPFPKSERTVTKASILRISSKMMANCLAACRQHDTSFTALLHTLVQITLASDEYRNAKVGFSRQAINIRDFLKNKIERDQMTNAVSVYYRVDLLSRFRKADSPSWNTQSRSQNNSQSDFGIDKEIVWELARKYKKDLNAAMYTNKSVMQELLVCKLLGEDDEDFGDFFGLNLYQNNSFLISNLIAFEPQEGMREGGWTVTDVAFSAGAIRAKLGDFGLVFNVASVKGADCVICAVWEEGVLKEEMVKRVIRAVYARMKLLVG